MTQTEFPTETKRQRAPSTNMWYAFLSNKTTGEVMVISQKTQTELKSQLKNIDNHLEVHFIVRGKGYKPRVQRSFDFVEGNTELESMMPAVASLPDEKKVEH